MALRLVIDRDLCMSSGRCVLDHPDAFTLDEDDELVTALPGADGLSEAQLRTAADRCPSQAIRLEDGEAGR